jgi:hypothetical protein
MPLAYNYRAPTGFDLYLRVFCVPVFQKNLQEEAKSKGQGAKSKEQTEFKKKNESNQLLQENETEENEAFNILNK